MQNYIKNITYIPKEFKKEDFIKIDVPKYDRLLIEPSHPSYIDSSIIFEQNKFKYPYLPLYLGEYHLPKIDDIKCNVLRLLIRENDENSAIHIPKELDLLKDFILSNINYHRQHYPINKNCFIYLTVRSSTYEELYYQNSSTWHIDGFQGAKIKRHIIEQNAIWSNKNPTEFSIQPYFCENLNPSKHDINMFFEEKTDEKFMIKSKINSIYFINPYNVHRVSKNKFEGRRVFIRLNFSPVLIADNSNTINPCFPNISFPYIRDVRDFLMKYKANEQDDSGFEF